VYLKWSRRQTADNGALLIASIVHSERRSGQPRQKLIAYVGSIRDHRRQDVFERSRLWAALNATLDALGLPKDVEQRLVNQLHVTVQHPDIEKENH